MHVIYTRDTVACSTQPCIDGATNSIDVFESFGTKYGLFIPFNLTAGYPFIDWIHSNFKLEVVGNPNVYIDGTYLHIDNRGRMHLINANTNANYISKNLYCGKGFAVGGRTEQEYIFCKYLLEGVETMAEAIDIINEKTVEQIPFPVIFQTSDWVEYAVKKGYKEEDIFFVNLFNTVAKPPEE